MSQLTPPPIPLSGRERHHLSGIINLVDNDVEYAAEQERPLKRTKVEEEEAGESWKRFCEICAERKEQDQMLRMESCSNSHAPYCSDCISRHVATKLQGGIVTVACPGVGCGTLIELESCRAVLSKGVIEQWEELLCRELIWKSEVYYCPFKDCSAVLVVEGEVMLSMRESECPHCHRLFCAQCRVAWHSGFDCQGFKRLSQAEGRGKEDIVVIEMAKSNKWGRCPRCKFYVERIEGCPHITCRCKYEFCYGCGADWSRYHGGCSRD